MTEEHEIEEEIKRFPLPEVPEAWDTIERPEHSIPDAMSYNYFPYSQVSSALQKSIRRCEWPEAAFWAMEAFRTGPRCATNIVRRLYIMAVEDIGPANPSLVVFIDDLFDPDTPRDSIKDLRIVLDVVELLTKSYKDRTNDWAAIPDVSALPEPMAELSEAYLLSQLTCLKDTLQRRNFEQAAEYANRIYCLHQRYPDFSLPHETSKRWKQSFKPGAPYRHYKKLSSQFWLPILGVASQEGANEYVCILVYRLYHLAVVRSGPLMFRNMKRSDMKLFWMQAIHSICYPENVEESWSQDGQMRLWADLEADGWQAEAMEKHKSRELVYAMPDYAVDKHTKSHSPETANRGTEHFMDHGGRIRHHHAFRDAQQKYWLRKAVQKLKAQGKLKQEYKLPENYFNL